MGTPHAERLSRAPPACHPARALPAHPTVNKLKHVSNTSVLIQEKLYAPLRLRLAAAVGPARGIPLPSLLLQQIIVALAQLTTDEKASLA